MREERPLWFENQGHDVVGSVGEGIGGMVGEALIGAIETEIRGVPGTLLSILFGVGYVFMPLYLLGGGA